MTCTSTGERIRSSLPVLERGPDFRTDVKGCGFYSGGGGGGGGDDGGDGDGGKMQLRSFWSS